MAGEDQERFEDYLELEQFIEELQAGHVVHPPRELTPTQANIYRMAALFRSIEPEEAEPRPEFADALKARLEQEMRETTQKMPGLPLIPLPRKQRLNGSSVQKFRVSRRGLLAGSAAAAAGLLAGAGIDKVIEDQVPIVPPPPPVTAALVPGGVPSIWIPVAKVAELGDQAIKFVSGNVVGFVIRKDDDDPDSGPGKKGEIIAMSAACTHMGCIVSWSSSDRKYYCPCHGGTFSEYGQIDQKSPAPLYLRPLPRLEVQVEKDGTIKVRVPMGRK